MEIHVLVVGEMKTNCYLLVDELTGKTVVVDPGDEGDFISQKMLELKLSPQAIIFTHGHYDHVLGALDIKLNFQIPLYLHQKDLGIYQKVAASARYWSGIMAGPTLQIDHYVKEKDQIDFSDSQLTVLETPGHTPGGICLYAQKNNAVFTGDTLFKQDLGRTDHKYSSALKLSLSLDKLFKLPDQTIVYPGHGESTYIGDERRSLER